MKIQQHSAIRKMSKVSLEKLLSSMTKKELLEIAKLHHMSGYSSCKKEELAYKIKDILKESEEIKTISLLLGDQDEEFLTKLKERPSFEPSSKVFLPSGISRLISFGYARIDQKGNLEIAEEFLQIQEKQKDESIIQKRRRKSFLLDCITAGEILYGVFPNLVLVKMFNRNSKEMGIEEVLQEDQVEIEVQNLPKELLPVEYEHGKYISKELLTPPTYVNLERSQKEGEFYIPTVKEIYELLNIGYLKTSSYRELLQFFREHLLLESKEKSRVEELGLKVLEGLLANKSMKFILQVIRDFGISLESKEQLEETAKKLNQVWNHTRMRKFRGFTPVEMVEIQSPGREIKENQKGQGKVYPNDPCPCGSGKKYKKCCGK